MSGVMILYRNIKIPVSFISAAEHDAAAVSVARKEYNKFLAGKFGKAVFSVYKKSVDARKRDKLFFIYTIAINPENPINNIKSHLFGKMPFEFVSNVDFTVPQINKNVKPVVVGFGPCGMFCAYILAMAGAKPIVIERGSDVDTRTAKVSKYWNSGTLDAETNVQFGEGGAGAFSDGKLLTRISDPISGYVLKTLNKFGAPDEILYLAKPHVGTDLLKNVVKNIREEIIRLGGQILFDSKLTGFNCDCTGKVTSVNINNSFDINCDSVFLCIGHSARDTFNLLLAKNITITPKAFSVGVRVEHLQSEIAKSLYGNFAECDALEKAQYTLSHKQDSRGVYSFCMCPGGVVVASASDNDEIVTNGMSYYKRDGKNANSAIAVSVNPEDYGSTVMGAINFQKQIETVAFNVAGRNGAAPIQLLGDFLNDNSKLSEPTCVMPTYTGKTELCNLSKIFPPFITDMLKVGFSNFEKQIKGFSVSNAVLTAPETRTSSPVRIERADDFTSNSCRNLYPCGEGAGYAGGITSAAVDGIRCALSYLKKVSEEI